MARKATKKSAVKAGTASKKTTKAIAVKSAPKAKASAARKPAAKAVRRSAADVAKLQKAVIKALKANKSAADIAAELGISRPYVYTLKNKG